MSDLLRRISQPEVHRGLEGVVVDETAISSIDGDAGRLIYRGIDIGPLARRASFEEVLYLLWEGSLPDEGELADFTESMASERGIPSEIVATLEAIADLDEAPMAALRTGVSMLSAVDPASDADPRDRDATVEKARRIIASIPTIVAAYDRLRRDLEPIPPREDLSYAANFLYMLQDEEPGALARDTFDMALTLHADHGLNASTFTCLVIASTYADIHSAITGGIGALSGPWHGGANQDVIESLLEIDGSDQSPIEWVDDLMDAGERIPGWGHRVYNVRDPRARILERQSELLAEETGERTWYDYASTIDEYLTDDVGLVEKDIAPNVDFYSGTVYYQLGIPIDLYTPIFAMSRTAGWVAHILEYQAENRLIRPRGRYVGSEHREFVPLAER